MVARPLFVVAGVGAGHGTGAASARVFSKAGYRVALIARNADSLNEFASELNSQGGEVAAFPIKEYGYKDIHSAFEAIKKQWPDSEIRSALWNAGYGVWKPFLELTEEEVTESVKTNVTAAFSFSREVILAFKQLPLNELGKRGTLLFTGATASLRGNTTVGTWSSRSLCASESYPPSNINPWLIRTSSIVFIFIQTSGFAAGKFGERALSQSLAKEFGKDNIHVAHAIIDGGILTERSRSRHGEEWESNPDVRLDPESIAKSYLYLTNQDRSAWTWELDLRPAHEKW